jgi:PEP-CTERM motif
MKAVIPALAAVLIGTIGAGSAAQAKVIDYGVVAIGGTITSTGAPLQLSTALDLDSATLEVSLVSPTDDSGLAIGDTVTVSPTDIVYGSGTGIVDSPLGTDIVKSWTDALGTFTETLTTVESVDRGTANAITVALAGTLLGPGFADTPATLILSATEAGGPGTVISASLTNASSTVPEPSTWVMMVLGFAGLSYAAVRRSSKDRTALAV